jgi:hypothetical protein
MSAHAFLLTLDSSQISTSPSNNFTVQYTPPVVVNTDRNNIKRHEIALINANLWYSWDNISALLGNNTLRYYNGSVWRSVTIPDGIYQLTDINNYLESVMMANNDYNSAANTYYISLTPNYNTLKCQLTISNSYQLDLSVSSLNVLLGFNSAIYTTSQQGSNEVDITNGVNALYIHCSAVGNSFNNGVASDIIYTFNPTSGPGTAIVISPYHPVYIPLRSDSNIQITQIQMQITDQMGRPINFSGQPVSYLLHIREVD